MGAFYDLEAPLSPQPPRQSSMLSRGLNEARRKIVLLALLGCLIVLTLAGFRRQDQIREMLDDQIEWTNNTASTVRSNSKYAAAHAADVVSSTKESNGKSNDLTKQKHMAKGPVLGNGKRSLSPTSLGNIRNRTLGVCTRPAYLLPEYR